jgi:phosphoglucosamine mutase
VDRARLDQSAEIKAVVETVERELGSAGRVLLRPSGTEPLVRVMVEAPTAQAARDAAEAIAAAVRASLSISA